MTYPRTYSRTSWVFCAALALVLAACDAAAPGESPTGPVIPGGDGIDAMQVPPDFDYATTEDAALRVEALTRDDRPMANVRFDVYDGDRRLTSGFTNERGVYEADLVVAVGTTELTVRTDYLGLPNEQAVTIENSQAAVLFGGDVPRDFGNVTGAPAGAKSAGDKAAVTFTYHSAYNNNGVPTTLVDPSDVVHADVSAAVNAAIPERQNLPQARPDYVNDNVTLDIKLDGLADVWVTFVHEGAGYKNALGFYTYDLAAPPASSADIAEHRLIFPNVSYRGSGGGLLAGDKV
ncbi:MAG: hypothetical protein AAGN64_03875, partial [Bacteroidota bacterium]